jgi:SAM-dependent methyltransferase
LVECNVCGWVGEQFGELTSPGHAVCDLNVFCPRCGAYERHRAAAYYLRVTNILRGHKTALEIGPGMIRAYKHVLEGAGLSYMSLDVWPGLGDVQGDVVAAPLATGSFDLIVCSHVLEHVSDDYRALEEIRRMMAPGGLVLLQLPYDDRRFETFEHHIALTCNIESGSYYGHVREYGLDIIERLRYFWPEVREIQPLLAIDRAVAVHHGFEKNYGTILICSGAMNGLQTPGVLKRNLTNAKRRWLTHLEAYFSWEKYGPRQQLDDWLEAENRVVQMSDEEVARSYVYHAIKRD